MHHCVNLITEYDASSRRKRDQMQWSSLLGLCSQKVYKVDNEMVQPTWSQPAWSITLFSRCSCNRRLIYQESDKESLVISPDDRYLSKICTLKKSNFAPYNILDGLKTRSPLNQELEKQVKYNPCDPISTVFNWYFAIFASDKSFLT